MANTCLIQVRIDEELKKEVSEIYEELGIDIPTAIRMFLKRSTLVKGLPFEATLPEKTVTRMEAKQAFEALRAQAAALPEMTLEEVNKEIQAVRAEREPKGE